ncbi:hypothetical protein [Chitinophaga caseinilytica]|uniref:ABC transporter permease n=1 Tax=Chitinophaga caseinilytica TaxID=2267521 RepID=A0ABZ2Z7F6_9BACT
MQFSLNRCVQLLKLQLVTDRKLYLYGALALFATQFSVLLYYALTFEDGLFFEKQEGFVLEGFIIFNFIMAAVCFRDLHAGSSRLRALMLPVSVAERIAVGVFTILVVLPVGYFASSFLSAGIVHQIDNQVLLNANRFYFFNGARGIDLSFLKMFLTIFIIGLAASAVFRKFAVVKAVAAFLLLFVGINAVNSLFARLLLDKLPLTESMREQRVGIIPDHVNTFNHGPFGTWYFDTRDESGQSVLYYQVKATASVEMIEMIAGYLMLFGLMYVTVLKLREQELS